MLIHQIKDFLFWQEGFPEKVKWLVMAFAHAQRSSTQVAIYKSDTIRTRKGSKIAFPKGYTLRAFPRVSSLNVVPEGPMYPLHRGATTSDNSP